MPKWTLNLSFAKVRALATVSTAEFRFKDGCKMGESINQSIYLSIKTTWKQ